MTGHSAPVDPLVSVALATYNGARYLEPLLASIEAQDHARLEIVVADDGSTDGTLDLLARRAWRRPHRILPAAPRAGVIGNFSRALDACEGDHLALADQDDVWTPTKLSALLARAVTLERGDATRPVLTFGDIEVVDQSLEPIAPSFFALDGKSTDGRDVRDFLLANHVPGCSMLFNRALLARARPIPRDFHMHDWWLILTAAAFGDVGFVDRPLIKYRQHATNVFGAVERRSSWTTKLSKIGSPRAWRTYLLPSDERVASTVRNVACFEQRFGGSLPAGAAAQLASFHAAGGNAFAALRFCMTARTGESLLYSMALLRAAAGGAPGAAGLYGRRGSETP